MTAEEIETRPKEELPDGLPARGQGRICGGELFSPGNCQITLLTDEEREAALARMTELCLRISRIGSR